MSALTLNKVRESGAQEIKKWVTPEGLNRYICELGDRGYKFSRVSVRCGYCPINYLAFSYGYSGQWGTGYCIARYRSPSTVEVTYYIKRVKKRASKH